MTPDQWLEEVFKGEYFSGQFDHLKQTVKKLKLDKQTSKVITIAGTNGKGETARSLAYLFSKAQKKYALWTSPHLKTVRERFVFNDDIVKASELLEAFEFINQKIEIKKYSYFEFIFLSFLYLCKEKQIDFIILEVGLGGRLDAANTIDADIACVVSISREHQRLLGFTFKEILFEKLGVARDKKKIFTAFDLDYLKGLSRDYCLNLGAHRVDLVETGKISPKDDFSKRNQILARELFESITQEKSEADFSTLNLAMRKSVSWDSRQFDLYPTHNLDGFRKLFHFLKGKQYNNYDYLLISFSKREWKDLLGICGVISQEFPREKVKLITFDHIKSLENSLLNKLASEFEFDIVETKNYFHEFKADDKILVTGSNYFLGEFLQSIPSGK